MFSVVLQCAGFSYSELFTHDEEGRDGVQEGVCSRDGVGRECAAGIGLGGRVQW